MPLRKSCSKAAKSYNISKLRDEGYKLSQALAIALSKCKKKKK